MLGLVSLQGFDHVGGNAFVVGHDFQMMARAIPNAISPAGQVIDNVTAGQGIHGEARVFQIAFAHFDVVDEL